MFARSWVNKVKFTDCSRLIYFPNRLSAVMSIGAATLADIFDPAVRGKKVGRCQLLCFPITDIVSKLGIYYSAPLLGPVFFLPYISEISDLYLP